MEKWEDGEQWFLVKDGPGSEWRRASEVGVYRLTDHGYESRDADGNWVNHAQMPQDTSHLTDAQRERLIKELKGEIKVSMTEGDLEDFMPTGEMPPLEKWPFYALPITEELKASEEELQDFRELEMSEELGKAFFLAGRWKASNEARRHLGYNVNDELDDVANMNGSVLALRCLTEQLKRTARYRKRPPEREPSDAYRLQALRATGLLGTKEGSAMAIWIYNSERKLAKIDICIGDDCMDQGPHAEEVLLRFLAKKAAELGAETLWCRSRRTESGRVYVPKYMRRLGFEAVPLQEQEEEEWEKVAAPGGASEDVVESVSGLYLWMSTRQLNNYLQAANEWCQEMGACDITEVAESKAELADYLAEEHGLTEEERERLLQF